MCTELEVLQAATEQRVVGLVDVLDRPHVMWVAARSAVEASRADTRLVTQLLGEGLVQRDERVVCVPYRDGEALAVRLLPTEAGVARLERLRDRAALAAVAAQARGAA